MVDIETDHDAESQLWWETTSGEPPPVPDRLDAVAIALVAKAMNFTQDLHLEGPVSWQLLANLEEYVDAWTMWRPDVFRRVALTADEVVDDRADGSDLRGSRGVVAFSGGIDSVYASYVNQRGLRGRRSVDLAAAILVQGFDIPLDDGAAFDDAATGARAITDEICVPLVTVRTNWKAVADPEWQMTFGLAVASTLHLFTDRAGLAVQAADMTYGALTMPWGSNPITSPLLSSRRMQLVQPGGGQTRTDKARLIGGLRSVRDHLRVCWEGEVHGRNCGTCEKCIRTKVNFLAAGHGVLPALGPLAPGELRSLTIRSEVAHAILTEMLDDLDQLEPAVAADVRWLVAQPIEPHR